MLQLWVFTSLLALAPGDAPNTPNVTQLPAISPGPSLTLAQALDEAATRNLTLQATALELTRAQAQLKLAWSTLLPTVSGQVQFNHNDHEDTVDIAGQVMTMLGQALAATPFAGQFEPPASEPLVMRQQEELRGSLTATVPLVVPQAWAMKGVAEAGVAVASEGFMQARE